MLNKVIIQGRLVADPEPRHTPSGVSVCSFRIACDRDFKNKDTGERETDFVNVVAWRQSADFIAQNFSKGSAIIVLGHLQVRQYTDKDGNKRTATDVIVENVYFCDSKSAGGGHSDRARNYTTTQRNGSYGDSQPQQGRFTELEDDADLPF